MTRRFKKPKPLKQWSLYTMPRGRVVATRIGTFAFPVFHRDLKANKRSIYSSQQNAFVMSELATYIQKFYPTPTLPTFRQSGKLNIKNQISQLTFLRKMAS